MLDTHHFSIIVVDVEGSGSLSDKEKPVVREVLHSIVRNSLHLSGVEWSEDLIEDRGDGVYLLVPGAIAKRRLGPPFVAELDRALGDRKVGDAPMRLRLVLHCGEVTRDKRGSSGAEVDRAFGMVNNDRVRQMLAAAPRARMVVVVSDEFYRGAFCSDPADDPTWFRCVDLDLKRGRMLAWVGVPGLRHPPVIEPDEPSKTDTVAGSQRDTPSGDVLFINGGVSGGMVGGRQNTNSGTINSGHIVTNSGSSGRG